MHRLFTGLLGVLVLYMLCGCAAVKDGFSRSSGQQSAQQPVAKASAPIPETNQTKVSPAPGAGETKTPSLIPETAQICRLDSGECAPPTPPIAGAPDKPGPVVQIPENTFDFGTMQGDAVFSHKFLIK